MPAYYSEFDPKAAAWLRELIKRGLIADGVVDERDLWDVAPADLRDFTQVHLCAGIGVWSYAARRAGVGDDRRVWTASFPCQPFSQAGKGKGFADERHLWPAGLHLIRECRPDLVFGEQVSSPDGLAWFDLVQADLEGEGYTVGAADTCSAGVGAPHIRQRLYWVADAQHAERRAKRKIDSDAYGHSAPATSSAGFMANSASDRRGEERAHDSRQSGRDSAQGLAAGPVTGGSNAGLRRTERSVPDGSGAQGEHGLREVALRPGPVNSQWRDADWLYSRDGFWRPVEPDTQPLVDGSSQRVGRLRGYGNAINAEAAKVFIESYLDTRTIEAGA